MCLNRAALHFRCHERNRSAARAGAAGRAISVLPVRALLIQRRAHGDEVAIALDLARKHGMFDARRSRVLRMSLRLLYVMMTAMCESVLRPAEEQHGRGNER